MVRGVEPHDFDIATSATPEEVQALFAKTVPVGAAFGVVLVIEDEHQFEVATFRSDDAYIDGRRPTGVSMVRQKKTPSAVISRSMDCFMIRWHLRHKTALAARAPYLNRRRRVDSSTPLRTGQRALPMDRCPTGDN